MEVTDQFSIVIGIAGLVLAIISVFYARRQTKIAEEQTKIAEEQRQITKSKDIELRSVKEKSFQCAQLFSGDDKYLEDVDEVLEHVKNLFFDLAQSGKPIKIRNFGLDLEVVVPWFASVLKNKNLLGVEIHYEGLIIDKHSESIKCLIDGKSDIKSEVAGIRLQELKNFNFKRYEHVKVDVRNYTFPSTIHGFMINENYLFLSFTEIKNNKMFGGWFPYVYIKYNDTSKLNSHFMGMFKSWFDYIFSISPQVYKKD